MAIIPELANEMNPRFEAASPEPSAAMREANKIDVSALIQRVLAGSSEALEQLISTHQLSVRLFLSRFVAQSAVVDDLAQETFVAAFKQLGSFRNECSFTSWLFAIARNKARTHLRNEMRWRKKHQHFIEMEIARQQYERVNHAELDREAAAATALKKCLSRLAKPARKLVEAYYFENKSSSEIGDESKQKSSAIRMKLMRIRTSLHKCIKRKLDEQAKVEYE